MTIISQHCPEVEEEFFHLLDYGIAWLMEELSTIYFSGLHFHGGSGCVARYQPANDNIFYRLTLVAYPPTQILNAQDSVALAAMPDGTPFRVGIEMRNPR